MQGNLQSAALDAAGIVGNTQWALAFVARHGNVEMAEKAVRELLLAASELQAALDEGKP